jgi:hypothetical protein
MAMMPIWRLQMSYFDIDGMGEEEPEEEGKMSSLDIDGMSEDEQVWQRHPES